MPTKIRLQRHGRKKRAFYHIVVADSRAPRDGKFIEKIGTYNPITTPAEINLDFERALHWIQVGAQPTDTARAILSYNGILMKNHLLKGVTKGALTEEQAEVKFQAWLIEKDAKINKHKQSVADKATNDDAARLAAETKVNEARQAEIDKKKADARKAKEDAVAEAAAEAVAKEEATEETKEEAAE
ncbi:MAG: 30S ribosomal protein S16 [Bacteroidales bacterium]|nr:30S ribosomal protein S16 [Bacteroidales bacterium]